LHGAGSGLTPEEIKKLGEYLADPFEALTAENAGYPLLKEILQKTERLMAEGKLKLKEDKMRKAKQAITEIVDKNSLVDLQKKCVEAKMQKARVSTSTTIAETITEMSRLQEHVENIRRKLERLESEEANLKRAIQETMKKIDSHKSLVEKNVQAFSGQEITVKVWG
jgi:predicted RNase H-like nuclease (RuvC/YqgF family)